LREGKDEEKQSDRYEHGGGRGPFLRRGAKAPPLLLTAFQFIDEDRIRDEENEKRETAIEEAVHPKEVPVVEVFVIVVYKATPVVFTVVSSPPQVLGVESDEDDVGGDPGDNSVPPRAKALALDGAQHGDEALQCHEDQSP
jgi:hypothetical protein